MQLSESYINRLKKLAGIICENINTKDETVNKILNCIVNIDKTNDEDLTDVRLYDVYFRDGGEIQYGTIPSADDMWSNGVGNERTSMCIFFEEFMKNYKLNNHPVNNEKFFKYMIFKKQLQSHIENEDYENANKIHKGLQNIEKNYNL